MSNQKPKKKAVILVTEVSSIEQDTENSEVTLEKKSIERNESFENPTPIYYEDRKEHSKDLSDFIDIQELGMEEINHLSILKEIYRENTDPNYLKDDHSREASIENIYGEDSDQYDSIFAPYGHIQPNSRLEITPKNQKKAHSRSQLAEIPEVSYKESRSALSNNNSKDAANIRHHASYQPTRGKNKSPHQRENSLNTRPYSKYYHSQENNSSRPISSKRPIPGAPLPRSEYSKLLDLASHKKAVYRDILSNMIPRPNADINKILESGKSRSPLPYVNGHNRRLKGYIGEKYTKLPALLLNDRRGVRLLRAQPRKQIQNYHEHQVNLNRRRNDSSSVRYPISKPDWWG